MCTQGPYGSNFIRLVECREFFKFLSYWPGQAVSSAGLCTSLKAIPTRPQKELT